ncbi:hypothetical protein [Pseudomonas synxantha]|uniref:hypothetical protein n=1 Tax=Pseudomonas synxantha TaxID=47883 RepID=UPI003D166D2F
MHFTIASGGPHKNSRLFHSPWSLGSRTSFEIHHLTEISKGGDVYNAENLRIPTPKRHMELHKKGTEQ